MNITFDEIYKEFSLDSAIMNLLWIHIWGSQFKNKATQLDLVIHGRGEWFLTINLAYCIYRWGASWTLPIIPFPLCSGSNAKQEAHGPHRSPEKQFQSNQ